MDGKIPGFYLAAQLDNDMSGVAVDLTHTADFLISLLDAGLICINDPANP
jgi:hypothetical protein